MVTLATIAKENLRVKHVENHQSLTIEQKAQKLK